MPPKQPKRPREDYQQRQATEEDKDRFLPIQKDLKTLINQIKPAPIKYQATVDKIGNLSVIVTFDGLKLLTSSSNLNNLKRKLEKIKDNIETAMQAVVRKNALREITSYERTDPGKEILDAEGNIRISVTSINA